MSHLLFTVALAAFTFSAVHAGYNYAVDISTLGSYSNLYCLKSNGYQAVFVHAYSPAGSGSVDNNAVTSIQNAYQAGLGIEVYITPSPGSFKTAATQVDEALSALSNGGITIRSVWLQVTSPVNWSSSQSNNVAFIQSAISRIRARGVRPGVYTNSYDWNQITNGASNLGSDVMLWYWNVYAAGSGGESPADFSDFRSFGQWTSPMAKQFGQAEGICSLAANRDVFPSSSLSEKSVATMLALRQHGRVAVGFIGL